MKLLAILPTHNATVGIFEDGICKGIFQEEKFSDKKNHLGWPHRTLKYLSEKYDFSTFDNVIITSEQQFYFPDDRNHEDDSRYLNSYFGKILNNLKNLYFYLWYKLGNNFVFDYIFRYALHNVSTPKTKEEIAKTLLRDLGIPKEKIKYVEHHLMHALTPYYFYGLNKNFEDVLFITVDGHGDDYFSRIYEYRHADKSFTKIAQSPYTASLGLLYAETTRFLGMKPDEHEYKVMGLAAYVSSKKYFEKIYQKLSKIIRLNEETLVFESDVNTFSSIYYYLKDNFVGERFDNIAAGVQQFLEDMMCRYIQSAIKKTGISTVAVSGGVFMNVKLNQRIMNLPEVEKVYFQPSCGDESSVIGDAAQVFMEGNVELETIKTMYLGNDYSDNEVGKFIEENKLNDKYEVKYYETESALFEKIVDLLKNFEIVGYFHGPGEWGARSLCNRTILGNASDLSTFYKVNDMIKMRDFWMPFAPTLLMEWAGKYIKDWDVLEPKIRDSSKYMIVTFDSTELAQKHLRAAIHQKDKTLRPQVFEEQDNPSLYRLFKFYEKETGMGGMLNTSLNIHGYPLVGTLEQALFTLENSGLKHLVLGSYYISKRT